MDETARLRAVRKLRVLDSPPDQKFDDLVALATELTGCGMGCISIFDHDRVWFKSEIEFHIKEVPRATSLCAQTMGTDEIVISTNLLEDPRFAEAETPTGVTFYIAVPLTDRHGFRLGNLCVCDSKSKAITLKQKESLLRIARQIVHHLEDLEPETKASLQAREILESITDGFFTVDRAFNITYVNDLALDKFAPGERKQNLIGTNLWTLFPGAKDSIFETNYRRCMDTRVPITFEHHHKEGDFWGEIRCYPNASGISIFFKDITDRKRAEQERERGFKLSLDIMAVSKNGFFVRVNPALVKISGHSEEELLSRPIDDFVHPEDRSYVHQARLSLLRNQTAWERQSRWVSKDGSVHWLSWQAVRDGEFNYLTARDITVHKKLEKIEASELKFRNLAESLPQIVFTTDAAGEINYYNTRWYEYTGSNCANPPAEAWAQIVHPDDLPGMYQEFAKSVAEDRSFEFRYRLKNKAGEFRWHLGRTVLVRGEDGQTLQRIGTATDIHDQIEAQRSVLEFKQRADAIITNAPILLWAVDTKGTFTFYEGNGQQVLGIYSKDRVGKNIFELYPDREEISGNTRLALTGETVKGESKIGEIWLENTFVPLYDQNREVVGVVGLSTDISARKKADEERKFVEQERAAMIMETQMAVEASRMKSEFLANMSHEIRTPINGIIGMSNLLAETPLNKEQFDFLSAISSSSDALLRIVNDVLDFSKIEAGKLELEDFDFDLTSLLHGLNSDMGLIARSKDLDLTLDLPADLPRNLRGDAGRLRQVLTNLLSNAIKFTARGEIGVKARLVATTDDGAELRFEIKDTGVGISEATKGRLFRPFSQADASTTRKFGGTGLGLSICKHLVDQFHGQIGVDSVEGEGSTFWFTVDMKFGAPASALPAPRFDFNLRRQLTWSPRVLIAEDNLVNQKIALHMMAKMGLKADAVASGRQVLEQLAKETYDLILMDCQMPEMDGYETTREIRASKTLPWANIPIIALTANAIKGDREKCLVAGMNDYVSKPVEAESLMRAVLACFSTGPAEAETPTPSGGEALIDKSALDTLAMLDPGAKNGVLQEVIQLFKTETPDRAAVIRQALKSNDSKRVVMEAHQIKSTSASLGATSLAALAARIEERGRAGDLAAVSDIMQGIEDLMREVIASLDMIASGS